MPRLPLLPLALGALLSLAGCWSGSLYAERPKDKAVDQAIDRLWADEIRKVARDGDWILSRSLAWESDMIVMAHGGEDFSHVSIVDAGKGTVIEAITPVVREITLEELASRNRYLVVVRPNGQTAKEARDSLDKARAQLGVAFDLWGFVGYQEEDKWFCTEMVWWASGLEEKHGKQLVLWPNEFMREGEVVYYSGRRDDVQVQHVAAERMGVGDDAAEMVGATALDDDPEIEIDP